MFKCIFSIERDYYHCLCICPQIAWGSASPVLSDRKRFPNFYRVIAPDQKLNPAKIALLEEFNWKKVATINQALEFFSMVRCVC